MPRNSNFRAFVRFLHRTLFVSVVGFCSVFGAAFAVPTLVQVSWDCGQGSGSISPSSVSYPYNSYVSVPGDQSTCIEPTGHVFAGWYCDAGMVDGYTSYTTHPAGTVSGFNAISTSTTCTAVWTPSCAPGTSTASTIFAEMDTSYGGMVVDNNGNQDAVNFSPNYGTVGVTIRCSETPGISYLPGSPSSNPGPYCWCRTDTYAPIGGTAVPLNDSPWVFVITKDSYNDCITQSSTNGHDGCYHDCSKVMSANSALRASMYGSTNCAYTVSYNCNGGSFVSSVQSKGVVANTSYSLDNVADICTRTNYSPDNTVTNAIADGWVCTADSASTTTYLGSASGTWTYQDNYTCTAQWKCADGYQMVNGQCVPSYTLTYNINKPSGVSTGVLWDGGYYNTSSTVNNLQSGASVTLLGSGVNAPSLPDDQWGFIGWDCPGLIGTTQSNGYFAALASATMPASNVTCTAQWLAKYRVSYKGGNCNQPTNNSVNPQSWSNYTYNSPNLLDDGHPVLAGQPYTVLTPSDISVLSGIYNNNLDLRDCIVFRGYGLNPPTVDYACSDYSTCESISSYDYGQNINLYAYCDWVEYPVVYHSCDGNGTYEDTSNDVVYKKSFNVATYAATGLPSAGYTFQGWATTAGATTVEYAASASYKMNSCEADGAKIHLYAVCEAPSYTITYNVNAPAASGITAPSAETVAPGPHVLQNVPSATGYTCSNWICGALTVENNAITMPSSNVTCTSTCTANTIGLQWIPNGGTLGGSMPQSCTYLTENSITPLPQPTKTGYTFNGWNVSGWDPCGFSAVAGLTGTDFWAIGINQFSNATSCDYNQNFISCSDSSFNDLDVNDFKVAFSYGTVYGRSKCSSSQYVQGITTAPTDESGQYCWCSLKGYTPYGGNQCNLSSASYWVASVSHNLQSEANCLDHCASACGRDVRINNGSVTSMLYGQ